jgi:hypothetical protein
LVIVYLLVWILESRIEKPGFREKTGFLALLAGDSVVQGGRVVKKRK